jgi:hypothetical protein
MSSRSLSENLNAAPCAESHEAAASLEHTMTNHLMEQTRAYSREEDEDGRADEDPNTGTDSSAIKAAAPILQSEDDEMLDEDAPK